MNITSSAEWMAVISALPDPVFILTESGTYVDVFGGQDPELYHDGRTLIAKNLSEVMPEEIATWFKELIRQTLDEKRLILVEYSLEGKDVTGLDACSGPRGELWFEGRISPIPSLRNGERAVVWVAHNITRRYLLEQELKYHSEVDALSRVYNRRKLFECLNEAFYDYNRRGVNSGFLLLDIDDFKQINDELGHQTGDKAIRQLATTVKTELRQSDVTGRLGGDEFGILCRDTSPDFTIALARRLNSVISDHLTTVLDGRQASVSIGVSHFSANDRNTDAVYGRADKALYQTKSQGKNGYSVL